MSMIGFRGMIHLYVLSVTYLKGLQVLSAVVLTRLHRRFTGEGNLLTFRSLPECMSS